jgi:hypothetical protein
MVRSWNDADLLCDAITAKTSHDPQNSPTQNIQISQHPLQNSTKKHTSHDPSNTEQPAKNIIVHLLSHVSLFSKHPIQKRKTLLTDRNSGGNASKKPTPKNAPNDTTCTRLEHRSDRENAANEQKLRKCSSKDCTKGQCVRECPQGRLWLQQRAVANHSSGNLEISSTSEVSRVSKPITARITHNRTSKNNSSTTWPPRVNRHTNQRTIKDG